MFESRRTDGFQSKSCTCTCGGDTCSCKEIGDLDMNPGMFWVECERSGSTKRRRK